MRTRRGGLWVLGGIAVAAAALRSAGTRAWLRRIGGRGDDRAHYEDLDAPETAVHPADDHAANGAGEGEGDELRLSLRARLAESDSPTARDVVGRENAAAADAPPVDRPDDSAVATARERLRARAEEAKTRIAEASDLEAPETPA